MFSKGTAISAVSVASSGCSTAPVSKVPRAMRTAAPKPNISTAAALKAALVAAKNVAYSQGTSGQHFTTVIARLGLVEALKTLP